MHVYIHTCRLTFAVCTVGVANTLHTGDVTTPVVVTAASADARFDGLQYNVSVVNADVYWPHNITIEPAMMAPEGQNATLTGGTLLLCCTDPISLIIILLYGRLTLCLGSMRLNCS